MLAFSNDKGQQYKEYLPSYMFMPHQQYKQRYELSKNINISLSSKSYFKQATLSFKDKTSFNNKHRLLILEHLNTFESMMET